MQLLERESHLARLASLLDAASARPGHTAFVCGEAGIGKTAVVDAFVAQLGAQARVYRGACEALFTPRPLGPLYDLAYSIGGEFREHVLGGALVGGVFHDLLGHLSCSSQPVVVVLEDLHWADHPTLDLVRFLARRFDQVPGLMIVTFRDDETGPDHPLAQVLADIPSALRTRIPLPPLTADGTARLAGGSRDATLHERTGGNPFFVTEVLAAPAERIPASIRDAVRGRAGRLDANARTLLEVVAVVPDRVGVGLLEAVAGPCPAGLQSCLESGLLIAGGDHLRYRHELARLAIEGDIAPDRRRRLNGAFVEALTRSSQPDEALARIAHHAIHAGHAEAILRHVPRAAAAASARSAHREAALLLDTAVRHAHGLPSAERVRLFEQRSRACFMVDAGDAAMEMNRAAHHLWRTLGDTAGLARNLIRRAELSWMLMNGAPDDEPSLAHEMIRLARQSGDKADLARAFACGAILLAAIEPETARDWHDAAEAHLSAIPSGALRVEAAEAISTAEFHLRGAPTHASIERLEEEAHHASSDAGRLAAWFKRVQLHARNRDLNSAEHAIASGIAFARDRDLDRHPRTLMLERYSADIRAARADWATALAQYTSFIDRRGLPRWMQDIFCRCQIELIRLRQGDGTAWPVTRAQLAIDEVRPTQTLPARYALHRVAVEIAWLVGDAAQAARSASILRAIGTLWKHPEALGEAHGWTRLLAVYGESSSSHPVDDIHQAATRWETLGCPYEAALALACGFDADQIEAVRRFDRVGAHGAAERIRTRLLARGIRSVPRGPQPGRRAHPGDLSPKEHDVLLLLATGASNAQIALQVHRSVRTIENQIAAVLRKLEARDRHHAVAIAVSRGWVQASDNQDNGVFR